MINRLLIAISLVLFALNAKAAGINHVSYITLDGIRWQDIYATHEYFPKLWSKHAPQLKFYGLPNSDTTMQTASIPISLPSYQAQLSGKIQPCEDNECGMIANTTLPEYLIQQLHFAKKDVAVFSSWPVIANALESKKGNVYNNVGNIPVLDPITNQADAVMKKINRQQRLDHLDYKPNRFDKYTFAHALHYFEKHQPKFLWISLVNADDEAHMQHLNEYHQLLLFYDDVLDQLFNKLKQMKLDKNTMVIVTTDHGRGNEKNWITHGKEFPEAKRTWAFVMNGELHKMHHDGKIEHYNTLSIRPTIEKVFSF